MKGGLRHDFVIPDLLRSSLWGWPWNNKQWPGKRKADDKVVLQEKHSLDLSIMEDPTAKHFLARARFFVSCRQMEEALADYNQVLHESPLEHRVYAERADVQLALHHDQEALQDLLHYSLYFPEDPLADLKLSYVYLLCGDFAEGQFHLRRFDERGKPDPNAKLIAQYILNFKRRMHIELGVADVFLKEEYSEQHLVHRAKTKERAFDLVGASEEYLMLYLLFEKEEYRLQAERIKAEIMERHRRKNARGKI